MTVFDLISSLLVVSAFANVILTVLFLKKPKTKTEVTYDAQAVLRDLATGPALIKIEYVDRSEVLLRSPRHFR